MFLIYTGVTRQSTEVLKKSPEKINTKFLDFVDQMEIAIRHQKESQFLKLIKEGWEQKKSTSPHIIESENISNLDCVIEEDSKILAHRLCGAGSGGYFLVFVKEGTETLSSMRKRYGNVLPLRISHEGIKDKKI